jgi:hypothetical protein
MTQVKILLIGVLILGVFLFGAGVYLAFKSNEAPVIQTSLINIATTPINSLPLPTTKINKNVTVAMNTAWTDTDVRVKSGQTIIINASGKGVWKNISQNNPNAVPSPYEECNPEGTPQNTSITGQIFINIRQERQTKAH